MATATFGAGCFWGVEAAFRQLPGVQATAVGYAGGSLANPTYEQVCSGRTGHVEVVQVEYDPATIGYERLLEVFFASHDPTQLDRQGPDIGTQYRSVIFVHDDQQQRLAEEARRELDTSGRFRRAIVTKILPYLAFYRAEEYHQRYLEKAGLAQGALP